jgi:hypothetical protein
MWSLSRAGKKGVFKSLPTETTFLRQCFPVKWPKSATFGSKSAIALFISRLYFKKNVIKKNKNRAPMRVCGGLSIRLAIWVVSVFFVIFLILATVVVFEESIAQSICVRAQALNSNDPRESSVIGLYVATLQGVRGVAPENRKRYDDFLWSWNDCGRRQGEILNFSMVYGTSNPKRGYGVTITFVDALSKALFDNVDMAIFFEDDARPQDCSLAHQKLRGEILNGFPEDAFLVLLGGHNFRFPKPQKIEGPFV